MRTLITAIIIIIYHYAIAVWYICADYVDILKNKVKSNCDLQPFYCLLQYHTTSFISNIDFYPTLGWLERGWTEEEYYRGPPPTLINIHCQCKLKQKMKETKCKLFGCT